MAKGRQLDFCTNCRKDSEYEIQKTVRKEKIRDKTYDFTFTTALCKQCGEEMSIPGLTDLNIKERDEQYRKAEGIISIDDIRKLMAIYNMGKAPLSFALGFGEITISRYLDGQTPSKNYSDIMKKALSDPAYMQRLLDQNRSKTGETAYQKATKAINGLKKLFEVSDKMLLSIAYIFEQMQEVTPLALQKLLYFIQGVYLALFDASLFMEDCYAWQHGPVYEKVYFLFRDFSYNPIDDNRFVLFRAKEGNLSKKEREVIDLILNTFGRYSGKTLETITHNEKPWLDAREGYGFYQPSNVVITKEEMKDYFGQINQKYDISSAKGLNEYINSQLLPVL